ncbi:TetR/AcrR family transcriptional regulator [Sandaracinobacter neustonicus]|uniref:TetR/AcrR family transcriptional regulator n=1 Tax=Sandaracinobacter neustonicus TaxID=1715348 RepID=A0A501XHM7_9SPHN|nr:TetR/AcrR family transcriptional regulator [Sandaracinobacter neustonicus]TPE59814.1 TetR/AcrR family transcriptional regulator [Sandaracinobacter neustonicus]
MTDAAKQQVPIDEAVSGLPVPKTERGRRTLRALLDAAALEFGASGFHATGITDITRRAGVALGSFYTYFASKEDIFRALVTDLSAQVKAHVTPRVEEAPDALSREKAALGGYLDFVSQQQLIYRIIDEAEFVAPDAYQGHYRSTVARVTARLEAGAARGELKEGVGEVEAWAIAGMNVFLGLRYGVWGKDRDLAEVLARAHELVADGLRRR